MRVRLITTALTTALTLLMLAAGAQYSPPPLQSTVHIWQSRSDSVVILYDGENQFVDPDLREVDERVLTDRHGRRANNLDPELQHKRGPFEWAGFTLRTNALYLLGVTPNLGVGWESQNGFGVIVSGAWAGWEIDGGAKRYKLALINPEVRYHFGQQKQWLVGMAGYWGEFNMKFSDPGRQGDAIGAGLVVGYRRPIGQRLGLELSLGGGWVNFKYDRYITLQGVDRLQQAGYDRTYLGPTNAGVSLVWKIH